MQTARGAAVAADTAADAASGSGAPRRRTSLLVLVASLVLVADVLSKLIAVAKLSDRARVTLIPHVLWLTMTRNAGAAFSVGTGSTIVFTAVAVAVVVVILRTARSLKSAGWAFSLGLLLGGALGNLSDRIFRAPAAFRGHVVDWIELPHWPIFNLADSAIVVGGVLAVLLAAYRVELDGTTS
jgi:lipoprotein signal peptidase